MKNIFIFFLLFLSLSTLGNAKNIKPKANLSSEEVILIQLNALKNNDTNDSGIEQTWLFAHPKNKKSTGPYARFRIMIYGDQYRTLLNHTSHKIELLMNSPNKYIFKIKILAKDKQLLFYEWHVEKASENNCKDCWFTSAVSMPIDQGNTI